MKTLLVSLLVLVCVIASVSAQEVRLDSLWAKFGGVAAMTFSPDSKQLLISERMLEGDKGNIIIYDAQNGATLDSITKTDFIDFRFTHDGKTLIVVERTKIRFFNSSTYDIEREIPYSLGGYIELSPDPTLVALYGEDQINIINVVTGQEEVHISRPESYKVSPTQTERYYNGKVCFSADGKYVIGKYVNALAQWDWRNAPGKPEVLIPSIPNRAILGFSPDKSLFVQQSNYLWNINEKKQIPVEGIETVYDEKNYSATFTEDGKHLFYMNGKLQITIINVNDKKIVYETERGARAVAVSRDKQYYSFYGAGNTVRTYHITWNPNSAETETQVLPNIIVSPLPGQDVIRIEVQTPRLYQDCLLSVISLSGASVSEIYHGSIDKKQAFVVSTTGYASGHYSIALKCDGQIKTVPFVITK